MPNTPPRRRLTRRVAPPRPTYDGAPVPAAAGHHETREARRPVNYVAREAVNVKMELRRVAGISATCFGLLAILAVIDRLG
ncbi:MAG: hypothetical protein EPO16_07475 [Dehalococcoidia bacterium]|nr:MAG: hypothetical protein EPO16_07475 [Dehalococcoidia bacterium]